MAPARDGSRAQRIAQQPSHKNDDNHENDGKSCAHRANATTDHPFHLTLCSFVGQERFHDRYNPPMGSGVNIRGEFASELVLLSVVLAGAAVAAQQPAPAQPPAPAPPPLPIVAVKPIDPPATPLADRGRLGRRDALLVHRIRRHAQRKNTLRASPAMDRLFTRSIVRWWMRYWRKRRSLRRRRSQCGSSSSRATRSCAALTAACGTSASRRSSRS